MKNLALTAAVLFYMGGASFSAVAQTEKAAPTDEAKQAPAVLPEKRARAEKIFLMSVTSYEGGLPYRPPPPRQGWSSIRFETHEQSTSCEVIATDLRYVGQLDSEGEVSVETTNVNAGSYLIHGFPLKPGPVDGGVEERTQG